MRDNDDPQWWDSNHLSPSDPMVKTENWPEPIPDLAERVEAEKQRRRMRDETFRRAVRREFSKGDAA